MFSFHDGLPAIALFSLILNKEMHHAATVISGCLLMQDLNRFLESLETEKFQLFNKDE